MERADLLIGVAIVLGVLDRLELFSLLRISNIIALCHGENGLLAHDRLDRLGVLLFSLLRISNIIALCHGENGLLALGADLGHRVNVARVRLA